MDKHLNLFIISSPLQALTVTNIQLQFPKNKNEKSIVLVEGTIYQKSLAQHHWDEIILGNYVRPRHDKIIPNLKANLSLIEKILQENQPSTIKLFISDLYWISNNVYFKTLLKKFKNNFSCALFDEGNALYAKQVLLFRNKFRSFLKYLWLKFHKLPYQILHQNSFEHLNPSIHQIFCYHPDLFCDHGREQKSIELQPHYLNSHLDALTKLCPQNKIQKGSVLFLSQAYLPHIGFDDLKNIILNMVNYFKTLNVNDYYIKQHHLDSKAWIQMLQTEFQFQSFQNDNEIAIEAYARYLNYEYIVSFSSSALTNLKKFGYQGTVISYGIQQFNLYKETKRINKNIATLFRKKNILLIG